MTGSSGPALDGIFCGLAATAPLTVSQIDDLLTEAIERRLPHSVKVLAWNFVAAEAPIGRIIHHAQRLKGVGHAGFAYELMSLGAVEQGAPTEFLVEKGLLAKINGDFATAARLFQTVAAAEPGNAFCRQELAAILPEVETIESIVNRFQADPLFLATARQRRYYRKALGEEPVNFDEVFADDGASVFDLAPEIAAEFARPSERSLEERIELLDVGRQRRRGMEGQLIVLHACDFVRVRIRATAEIIGMRARIDGRTVGTATPAPVPSSDPFEPIKTWIVNCWMDLSDVSPGAHLLQVYCEERTGGYRSREELVWVDPTPVTFAEDQSASLFDVPPDSAKDLSRISSKTGSTACRASCSLRRGTYSRANSTTSW